MNKTYGLGWFIGRDGETHCGVDQEELKMSYTHKKEEDVRKATITGIGGWEIFGLFGIVLPFLVSGILGPYRGIDGWMDGWLGMGHAFWPNLVSDDFCL